MSEGIPRAQVILADPPWEYTFGKGPRSRPRPQDYYPVMKPREIGALPVADLAASDAILLLWTTSANLPAGLRVLEEWGFKYASSAIWHKSGLGMGYYWRVNHEFLLLGTRGEPMTPEPKDRMPSVFWARKGRHSAKPGCVYTMVERMYPEAVKLELFCRTPQPGWYSWGNEAFPTLFSGPILPGEALAARVEE